MKPKIPRNLLAQAGQWNELHRWERSELGKQLRRLGLTYGEIREIIPVPKGTLSNWCREVALSDLQKREIQTRTPTQKGVPKDTQWRRRTEIDGICAEARQFAKNHRNDAEFVAGVVLYWAEGSKTRNDLVLANTDPRALRLFIGWTRRYLDKEAEFVLSLHLHEGNDEATAMAYWRKATSLVDARFTKTFVKPAGTGHRKNTMTHGVCRVRVMRSSDHWNRIMTWIDVLANHHGRDVATLAPGR
ncbi:MAG: hypothetical protein GY788_07780 [bacterium]|nr:hypothetical protein [bacterium]